MKRKKQLSAKILKKKNNNNLSINLLSLYSTPSSLEMSRLDDELLALFGSNDGTKDGGNKVAKRKKPTSDSDNEDDDGKPKRRGRPPKRFLRSPFFFLFNQL
jgi:hypothetical protein